MRNIALGLAFVFALFLAGCNTPGCLVEDKVASVASDFVSSSLQCANPDAVKKSMLSIISAVVPTLCKNGKDGEVPQGPIANTLCPIVADTVVNFVTANGIPAEWGCSAVNASALAKSAFVSLCEKLPMSVQ
jgi:hypothetical protein